jgi:hypothetical protein
MEYQSVSKTPRSEGDAARAAALAWLDQQLRFERWLARVREPAPRPPAARRPTGPRGRPHAIAAR